MSKKQVHHIVATLGWENIASRVEVGWHMIRRSKSAGLFPAGWYNVLKDMCDKAGIPCPLVLFSWKVPDRIVSIPDSENQD
jgi:hypothetical protein